MILRPQSWPLALRALALLLLAQAAGLSILLWNGERIANRVAEAELTHLRDRNLPRLAAAAAPAMLARDVEQLGRLLDPWLEAEGIASIRLRSADGELLYEAGPKDDWPAEPRTLVLPVESGSMVVGRLEILLDKSHDVAAIRESATSSMVLVAAGLSFCTLVLIVFAIGLGRQLSGLARAAQAIAEGVHDTRAPVTGPPELRLLASAFNRMVEQLLESNRQLEEERRRLAQSEQRFRDFASAASDWLWETDAEHRFVYFSRQNDPTHLMGQERFLGMRRWELIAECDPAALRAHMDDLAQRRPFRDFRCRVRDRCGRLRTLEVSGVPQFDEQGRFVGYRGVGRDVTEREEAEQRIFYLAHHDTLTRLANRASFTDQLRRAVARARRDGAMVALHLLDVDGFRRTNELFGQEAGDALLLEMAERIAANVRQGDIIARLAADEFAVLQLGVRDPGEPSALAARLLACLAQPYGDASQPLYATVSCGIALFPGDAADPETLLGHASMALARAKSAGGGCVRFFEPNMEAAERRRRNIEAELRRALHGDGIGLRLHLQPRVRLRDGRLLGAEALLRWQHPELGEVSPAVFVPIAEQSGLIHLLGTWTMREA